MNDNNQNNSPSSNNPASTPNQHPLDALSSQSPAPAVPQADLDQAAKDLEAQAQTQAPQAPTPPSADGSAPAAPAPAKAPEVTMDSPTTNPPTPNPQASGPSLEEHAIDKPIYTPPQPAQAAPPSPAATPQQATPTLAEPAVAPQASQAPQPQPAISDPGSVAPPSQEERKELENKAKTIVKDKSVGKAPKSGGGSAAGKIAKIGGGLAALAIAAAGVLAGTGAIQIPGIADIRQQASGCSTGWSCNGACADQNTVNLFNNTWCDGQARWMYEAGCGGNASSPKSEGCGGTTSCSTGWSCNGACADQNTVNNFNNTWCDGQGRWMYEAGCGGNASSPKSEGCGGTTDNNNSGSCSTGWSCNGNCASSSDVNIFNNTWCDGKAAWLQEAGCGGGGSTPKSEGCGGTTDGDSRTAPPNVTGACNECGTGCSGDNYACVNAETTQYCPNGHYVCRYTGQTYGTSWCRASADLRECEVNGKLATNCTEDPDNPYMVYCFTSDWSNTDALLQMAKKNEQASDLYAVYNCPTMTDISQGCQENYQEWTNPNRGPSCELDNFCGWVQYDYPTGFNSFYCPCESAPPPEEPNLPPTTDEPPPSTDEPPPDEPPTDTVKSLSCQELRQEPKEPKIGDYLYFQCDANASGVSITSYEFRYNIDGGDWVDFSRPDSVENRSGRLRINEPGTYLVQCRACASSENTCTPWSTTR